MIVGERSNGKTYDIKKLVQEKFKNTGGKFVYLRRLEEQIARKEMKRLFEDQSDLSMDLFGDYIHYTTEAGFFYYNSEAIPVTIGYPFCVEKGVTKKGIPWNDVTTIFFDEFLEYGRPIENEFPKFLNVVSTIVRKRKVGEVDIYMVANTVTQFSEYFKCFGIDPKKLKQGQIMYFKHQNGVTCAIEYCRSANIVNGVKQKNDFLGFDNSPTSSMILYGEWEYDVANTAEIDGIGWNCNRRLLPFYITALGETYELSMYESDDPILFVRKLNTQNGEVRREIRYNISYDNSIKLFSKNGIVPMYSKINKLCDDETRAYWDLSKSCIEAKRVVYDKIASGSDFMKIYPYVK